jgi:hypothetical protein
MPVLRTLFVLVLCISTGAAADKLQTLAGKEIQGDLVSIDTKNITIDTATGPIRVPVQTDVLHVDLQPVPPITNLAPCTQVELTDGSLLHCKPEGGFVIKGKQVQLTLLNDLKMELPITALSTSSRKRRIPRTGTTPTGSAASRSVRRATWSACGKTIGSTAWKGRSMTRAMVWSSASR